MRRRGRGRGGWNGDLPDAFEVHWADLDYVLQLLALEDAVSSSAGHACYVEELGAVDHMVIFLCQNLALKLDVRERTFTASNACTLDINLEAQCGLILPKCSSDSRLHANRRNLTSCIHALRGRRGSLKVVVLSAWLDMRKVHGW